MFRKPNSAMTAVEIVSSMHDGPIPAGVMMHARAEDAAFLAAPQATAIKGALDNLAWNTACAQSSIERVRDYEAIGEVLSARSERKQVLATHLKARRQYQRELANLRAFPA